jgi:general stress protein 26
MGWMPRPVHEALNRALVAEFTVVGANRRPITHPMIPLWDGETIFVTSSVLFSRKVEHVKRDGRVALSVTDPVATGGLPVRCCIQGDAIVIEDDPHTTWERVLPLWEAKEPAIADFVRKRYALPLFFERSLIEIAPRRVLWWEDGDTLGPPQVAEREGLAR